MSVKEKFREIIKYLITENKGGSITGIDIDKLFNTYKEDDLSTIKKICSSVLIKISGKDHSRFQEASEFLNSLSDDKQWQELVSFFNTGEEMMMNEIQNIYKGDADFKTNFDDLYVWLDKKNIFNDIDSCSKKIREVFFPEGSFSLDEIGSKVLKLREKRRVKITALNDDHIKRPEYEMLFTANALITIPPRSADIDKLDLNSSIKVKLKDIIKEKQLYWYDHPVQIGTPPENNEVIYGLEKLDEALGFEEKRGIKDSNRRVDCILSGSVTHKGLQEISKDYMESELKQKSRISRLNIYVFTERDTEEIINEILIPAADKFLHKQNTEILYQIFGVDGEYGRHYSFLKAVAALWNVLISNEIKGTFKIDLDQVFPQKELLEQTGATAFEHFTTKLWGANGKDSNNKSIHLGLIAGALVNEKDLSNSLFTPDVKFPDKDPRGDTLVFYSLLPQALSTAAEMQTRYGDETGIDGVNECIQRIHVTGGTNGILIESLKRYRPFTPSFIGRAEDQAYIMSVLFDENERGYLRYVHRDGLIMRHDKEAFASEAIKAAKTGKIVGDYVRIILFSYYADSLPWPLKDVKNAIDPFTGSFVSQIPWTIVLLRLLLKASALFSSESIESEKEACSLLAMGAERLGRLLKSMTKDNNPLKDKYIEEKRGWDLYYDILYAIEIKLNNEDDFAKELQERAEAIIGKCRLEL